MKRCSIRPIDLTVEYERSPLGVGAQSPVFGWRSEGTGRGLRQSAYRLMVATRPECLCREEPDIWDSGEVSSEASIGIPYGGKPLDSARTYYWTVRVRDGEGSLSGWSEMQRWATGLLNEDDWHAKWIGPSIESVSPSSPLLRKSFEVDDLSQVESAYMYATALGLYYLRCNGEEVSDRKFAPGWSDYRSHVRYQTYDVKSLLRTGENAVGAVLGPGWYAGHIASFGDRKYGTHPAFLAQLVIRYTDGRRTTVVTDESWRIAEGPIREADLIHGETYDAKLERDGWDRPGYRDADWLPATRCVGYKGKISADPLVPIRVTEEMIPISVRDAGNGRFIFDMGQNMVGYVRLKCSGTAGTRIRLRFAEMLDESGELYTDNLRGARQTDTYITKGEGEELYEPRFTFHGFRYVEVSGYPGKPKLDAILGKVVHSDMARTARFVTSDPYINKLASNIEWGQRGNFVGIPTDCPQRDERLGWTGDVQIFARTASYLMNTRNFYKSWLEDVRLCQKPSGAVPDVVPDIDAFYEWVRSIGMKGYGTAGWGDAIVIVPWTMYEMYGDTGILRECYPSMKNWIEYLTQNSDGFLRPDEGYGDWLSVGANTPRDVLGTAYYAYVAELMSRIAGILGEDEDELKYRRLHGDIANAFAAQYIEADGGIRGNTQTGYVLALFMKLAPESIRPKLAERLADDIRSRGNHLSTGFLGVGYLLPVLSDHGYHELACELLQRFDYPSWLYSITHGATTIWERWDGWTEENGFQDIRMNSFNHYSLGSVGEWMFRRLAGIDTVQAGFRAFRIAPLPGGSVKSAAATYRSMYGEIRSEWRLERGTFRLAASVPVNTRAEIRLPGTTENISESGYPFEIFRELHPSAIVISATEDETIVEVGSGDYIFESRTRRDEKVHPLGS